ncbi:mitochondrial genome maintenance exonuclease 1-like [Lycorma delicatula]|uniref:mitochondrial genome maintenance exonuclease 1-like n=1 Tax=Lycorma delicatula TaxID=130591 RepID=UPI003F50FF9A
MFRSKSLLCLRKAAVVGTKFVEKSSNTSWTKIFNTENKYLFGDLLESQGNRKKRLTLQKTRESAVKFQTVQKVHYEKQKPSKIVSSEPINNDAVIGKKEESDKKYSFNLTVPLGKVTEFPLINNTKVKLKYKLPKNGALSFDYSINYDNEVLKNIPSVSRILKATMPEKSKLLLENWQKKMIAELGVEGFESMNKAKLKQGSDLHEYIRKYLLNGKSSKEFDTAPVNIITILKSLKSVFKKLSDVCVLESHVIHSELPYRGIIDCVAKYNGKLAVIEWKHSDKRKPYIQWTYDAPIQLSAYLGALNYDNNYRIPVKAGMVVVAYTDGSPADVFWLTNQACERYWKSWLSRLFEFISTHANQ